MEELIRQSQELTNIVEDGTLKQYFIHQEDIRQCPSIDCEFSGFVEVGENGTIGCADDFECPKCEN